VLTEKDGELEVLAPLDADQMADACVVILAGAEATHREALKLARAAEAHPAVIDATGTLEGLSEARICAPLFELAPSAERDAVHIPAHPAAVALARLVRALEPRRTVATLHAPASERGRAGIDELHQQSLKLFNFQALPKEFYDTQIAYNMVARYGEEAPAKLASVELRIEQHLATLLGPQRLSVPSIRLVQAPVFHGYTISVWSELAERVALDSVQARLAEAGFQLHGAEGEPASNTGVAGQSGVTVSEIAVDRNAATACWLWLTFDNLRAHADNVMLSAALLGRGRGI
jgi:aspartate-semialdehyde dehydrogenase